MNLMDGTECLDMAMPLPQNPESVWPLLPVATNCAAEIRRGEQGWYLVNAPELTVRIAVSCLVEPVDGDRVLVAPVGSVCYVIAILERDWQSNQMSIDLGGAALSLKAASLHLEAEQNIGLQAVNLRLNSEFSVQNTTTQVVNVAGVSVLNADSVAIEGRKSYTMHTQLGAIQAGALLKIDGTQMHFG